MKKISGPGFTLIEVMIVVLIIGILAALAMSSYSQYTYRSRRVNGQTFLQSVAMSQARYYSTYNKYTSSMSDLGFSDSLSKNEDYKMALTLSNNKQSFKAVAEPMGVQAGDACGKLSLKSTGAHSYTGDETNGACW